MIIPNGFGQITHFFSGSGVPFGAAVTLGVNLELVLSPLVAAEDAHAAWAEEVLNAQCDVIQLDTTLVKFGPNDTGPFATYTEPLNGLQSSAQAPPQVAALVKKVTLLGGRKGRGRFYVPGIPEIQISNGGSLESQYRSDFQQRLDNYVGKLEAAQLEPALLHNDQTPPTLIERLELDGRVATQRRRLRG